MSNIGNNNRNIRKRFHESHCQPQQRAPHQAIIAQQQKDRRHPKKRIIDRKEAEKNSKPSP